MKLRDVLKEMDPVLQFKMLDERSFDCLALVASDLKETNCIFLDGLKYKKLIKPNVSMILTTEELMGELRSEQYGLCILEEPRLVFFKLHNYLSDKEGYKRKTFKTTIGKNCKISSQACISKSNVKIGDNVVIEEFVSIRENTVIGDNCIIRMGTKIGGQGFEFKQIPDTLMAVEHSGGVIIGNNVELQQNNCVDKAIYPWDNTTIDDYSKTDNFVHIAHGVKVGKRVRIAASAMVAGRVIIHDDVWIGPSAAIINGIELGTKANISLGSVVTQDVKANQKVTGNFAIDHKRYIEFLKSIR